MPSPGQQQTLAESITESLPPEVPARPSLTLPRDIDNFPFSSFISIGFQVGSGASPLPFLGQPPPHPQLQQAYPCLSGAGVGLCMPVSPDSLGAYLGPHLGPQHP